MEIVIIEDEKRARNLLVNLIKQQAKNKHVVHEAENLKKGVELIKRTKPNLVFLDIEMPQQSGIHILEHFEDQEINFEIVFTTAYSEYALNAFEMNAIDYLLKPLRPEKVKKVIEKIEKITHNNVIREQFKELQRILLNKTFNKIGFPDKDGVFFISLKEILHVEADGMYSKVHTQFNGIKMIAKPLKFFDQVLLKTPYLYKIHRSHIVNINFINKLIKKDGCRIILEDGTSLPIAKNKKNDFLKLIK